MSGRYRKRKKNGGRIIAVLSVILAVCVLLAVFLGFMLKKSEEAQSPAASKAPTLETTQPPTETQAPATQQTQPTEPPTEPTTEPPTEPTEETTEPPTMPQQPDLLTHLLDQSGITYEELAENNCSQLVTVVSSGTKAQIRFFSCLEGAWEELTDLNCKGRVGRNGVSEDKREGDGCTPTGLYGIGSAFYIADAPDTKLDMFQITDETYWVDDPNSAYYNQRVEGTQNKDWKSAEYMISYDVYRYGFVVDYNVQAVKNAGSAIFFHVGDNPTAGCVATAERMVLAYLKELDKERNPHILIVDGDNA